MHRPLRLPAHFCCALIGIAAALAAPVSRADCFDDAATYHRVNPMILRAIAWQESHNRAHAMHVNANGSRDYGVMQINSVHLRELARYQITPETLMNPCKNIYVAAWHLRGKINKYGNTWTAIGAYHSETPAERDRYAGNIAAILMRWHQLP